MRRAARGKVSLRHCCWHWSPLSLLVVLVMSLRHCCCCWHWSRLPLLAVLVMSALPLVSSSLVLHAATALRVLLQQEVGTSSSLDAVLHGACRSSLSHSASHSLYSLTAPHTPCGHSLTLPHTLSLTHSASHSATRECAHYQNITVPEM